MLRAYILAGFDRELRIYFSKNSIKLDGSWKLGAYPLCYYYLLEGLRSKLIIMNRSSPVLELFIVLTPWDNPVIILFGPSEAIQLGIWVCYLPRNYISMIFLVKSNTHSTIYFISWPFYCIWTFYNYHGRHFSLCCFVDYYCSLWSWTLYLYRILFLLRE